MKSGTYYDEISQGYEELHKEEQEKKLEIIKQHIKPNKKDKLLDVGCGTGVTSNFDCDVTGIDPSKNLLERCPKNIKTVLARAESIPFPDRSFDHVISVTAIQNFDDIEKGLREIKRVGKDSFALSFLKRSTKRDMIDRMIKETFDVQEVVEEEKDIIYFCQ